MSNSRPPEGTPELESWLLARARFRDLNDVVIQENLAESVGEGLIAGPENIEDIMPEKSASIGSEIEKAEKRSHLKVVK